MTFSCDSLMFNDLVFTAVTWVGNVENLTNFTNMKQMLF